MTQIRPHTNRFSIMAPSEKSNNPPSRAVPKGGSGGATPAGPEMSNEPQQAPKIAP